MPEHTNVNMHSAVFAVLRVRTHIQWQTGQARQPHAAAAPVGRRSRHDNRTGQWTPALCALWVPSRGCCRGDERLEASLIFPAGKDDELPEARYSWAYSAVGRLTAYPARPLRHGAMRAAEGSRKPQSYCSSPQAARKLRRGLALGGSATCSQVSAAAL